MKSFSLKLNVFRRHIPILIISLVIQWIRYILRYSLSFLIFALRFRFQVAGLILSLIRHGKAILSLPNGERIVITSLADAVKVAYHYTRTFRLYTKVVKFVEYLKKKFNVKIPVRDELIEALYSMYEVFSKEPYRYCDVKGKIVVDVGAYIGDTVLYFLLRGARKVIAIEPFYYHVLNEIVELNNLKDKVLVIPKAIGSKRTVIKCEKPSLISGTASLSDIHDKKACQDIINIEVVTLDDIVKTYEIDNAVLKIDCEGCEYDIILNSSDEVLRKFECIMIEYHHGYKNLVDRLRKLGFKVKVTPPRYSYTNRSLIVGYIYARQDS